MKGRCASGLATRWALPPAAEREVADLLPMEADPADAQALSEVAERGQERARRL
jgi:hypothetical protein